MDHALGNYLLIDHDTGMSRSLITSLPHPPTIVAGINMRALTRLMLDDLINDYCYCDFSNEISVAELASYLYEHYKIEGILLFTPHYRAVGKHQKWIYDSLHPDRLTYYPHNGGFEFSPLITTHFSNHLSCNMPPQFNFGQIPDFPDINK